MKPIDIRAGKKRGRPFLKWSLRIVLALVLLLVLLAGGSYVWLRTSLPQLDGTVAVTGDGSTGGGLQQAATIGRDDTGVVEIKAANEADAAFALGFAHAQDRLFQMDGMRRLGSGRLSEILGPDTLYTDQRMRILGLRRQAEAQYAGASPELRRLLEAYAAGVNAYLTQHKGAWPPEFVLLRYTPEPWTPIDSLIWGRLMALRLSGNAGDQMLNTYLQHALDGDLYSLIVHRGTQSAGLDGPSDGLDNGPGNGLAASRAASNNWVVAGSRTASGKPILSNDPHLGLTSPSTWYLAKIVTPERTLIGATAPGLPLLVLGTNGHVAWGFTTTMGDVEDLYDEKLSPDDPNLYVTPDGTAPFATRTETVKVRGQPDAHFVVRSTRHGPVISDTPLAPPPPGSVLSLAPPPVGYVRSLAAAVALPDDHTPDALLRMSHATNGDEFRAALHDFAAPQQNIAYADTAGTIGFVAAGRVPVRRNLYDQSRLPVPGWTDATDWTGVIPFDSLPQQLNPPAGWIATANNDISAYGKGFISADFDPGFRYRRIAAVLSQAKSFTLDDTLALQQDILSANLRDTIREWLPMLDHHTDIAASLEAWDGRMRRDQAEPLIAIAWMDQVARHLLADRMGAAYGNWWMWQTDTIRRIVADGRWCDAPGGPITRNCRPLLNAALDDALMDLGARYGADWRNWRWGDAHRVRFDNAFWSVVPVVNQLLNPDLPADGDNATVNNGTPLPPERPIGKGRASGTHLAPGGVFPDIHGPSMRFSIDMADPLNPVFALAGGQSGNPLSPHYDDLLRPWRDGQVRPILLPITHQLVLQPAAGAR